MKVPTYDSLKCNLNSLIIKYQNKSVVLICSPILLLCFLKSESTQQGDTLEWLPVGTGWVYIPYHSEAQVEYSKAVAFRFRVVKDTVLCGLNAKIIVCSPLIPTGSRLAPQIVLAKKK